MSDPADVTDIEITPQRTQELASSGGALIVDVREPYEWDAGRIDGARHIALEHLSAEAASLPKDQPIVFQCRLGGRSLMAAQAFRQAGFDAYSLTGGLQASADAGLPLTPEDGVVADH